MKPLVAIRNSVSNNPNEKVLINVTQDRQLYELDKLIVVEKIPCRFKCECEWRLFIEERGLITDLLDNEDIQWKVTTKVDLIELLGHPLILNSYQNLIIYSSKELVSVVSFVQGPN